MGYPITWVDLCGTVLICYMLTQTRIYLLSGNTMRSVAIYQACHRIKLRQGNKIIGR
jgi:hypothetical protein